MRIKIWRTVALFGLLSSLLLQGCSYGGPKLVNASAFLFDPVENVAIRWREIVAIQVWQPWHRRSSHLRFNRFIGRRLRRRYSGGIVGVTSGAAAPGGMPDESRYAALTLRFCGGELEAQKSHAFGTLFNTGS